MTEKREELLKRVQRLETLKDLKDINFYYYMGLHQAKKEGIPIVYTNALAPAELVYALGAIPVYPENHAVAIQAKQMALQTIDAAEADGYTPDICSYARCDLGYVSSGKSPIGGIPAPDLVLFGSVQCWTIGKWFEELARRFKVPFFTLDVPVQGRGFTAEIETYAVDYVVEQFKELIVWMEKHTGMKMQDNQLQETMHLSREAAVLWWQTLECATAKPSPMTLFDQYQAMAPIVDQRGKQHTVDFYAKLLKEVKERAEKGIGGIPDEKYRLYWDGLPLWQSIGDFYMILLENKANLVANNYTRAWAQLSVEHGDYFRGWAENYLRWFDPMIIQRAWDIAETMKHFDLDGYLLHSDHSCRFLSLGLLDTQEQVTKMSGKPGLLLDTDHGDPRLYQSEQIRNRIEAYLEAIS